MDTSPLAQKFILHFGEMGGKWGIGRATAQVFALLFLSSRPLHAAEIAEHLRLSRSHVSIAVRELLAWRLIVLRHLMADRKDYYSPCSDDIWQLGRVMVEERRRREVLPTETALKETLEISPQGAEEKRIHAKIKDMSDALAVFSKLYEDTHQIETQNIRRMLLFGGKLLSLYGRRLKKQNGKKPKIAANRQ